MKKIYLLFMALFALVTTASAQTQIEVITSVEPAVTDLSTLKEGDRVVLYNTGRLGWVIESDDLNSNGNNKLYLSNNLSFGQSSTSKFIWIIEDIAVNTGEDGGYTMKFKNLQDHYIPTFTYDESLGQWNLWGNCATTADVNEAEDFVVTVTGAADSTFYIIDRESVYFNGQNLGSVATGVANFVGWNAPGENSLYSIQPVQTELKDAFQAHLMCLDALIEGEIPGFEDVTIEGTTDDVISAPSIPYYDYDRATDYDENEFTLPYTVEEMPEADLELILYYKPWPIVTITCKDEAGNLLFDSETDTLAVGTVLTPPDVNARLQTFGYVLVKGEESYTLTEDDRQTPLSLEYTYRMTTDRGLPFVPTNVENGQFADDTKYYFIKLRGGYIHMANVSDDDRAIYVHDALDSDSVRYYTWALTGNTEEGFSLYNLGLGASLRAYTSGVADGTQLFMGNDEEIAGAEAPQYVFGISHNGTGYSLNALGEANACLNRFGGTSGTLVKYWNNSASPADDGSRFVFEEVTADQINAYEILNYSGYLKAEGCVGGYTADQLVDLKAAVETKDIAAAKAALEALADADTIAFDRSKRYNLISAYQAFRLNHAENTYAMGIKAKTTPEAKDTVNWKSVTAEELNSDLFKWEFKTASDSTYTLINVAANECIAGFRFGGTAVIYNAEDEKALSGSDIFAEGARAPFQMLRIGSGPAAYRFFHSYIAGDGITLCTNPVSPEDQTEGTLTTYNTSTGANANFWFLKPLDEKATGIGGTTVITPEQQKEVIYDLSGRRVQKAEKGIYIINGKKVLVK